MSLLSRDRVLIGLEPRAVHAVRLKTHEKRSASGAWPDALKEVLAGWTRAEATVVASNRLVRYVVVPRTAGVSGEAEETALARHHFTRVYGERARDWDVRYSRESGLASAIDAELVEGLRKALKLRSRAIASSPAERLTETQAQAPLANNATQVASASGSTIHAPAAGTLERSRLKAAIR